MRIINEPGGGRRRRKERSLWKKNALRIEKREKVVGDVTRLVGLFADLIRLMTIFNHLRDKAAR